MRKALNISKYIDIDINILLLVKNYNIYYQYSFGAKNILKHKISLFKS